MLETGVLPYQKGVCWFSAVIRKHLYMLFKSDGKNMYFSSVLEKIGYIGLTEISYCAKYEASQ